MTIPKVMLANATFELFDAAIEDSLWLARLLGAAVAEGWEGFPEALPVLRDSLAGTARARPWGAMLFLIEAPRTLVGLGGYKAAEAGIVEIGYAVAPAFRGRGLATEAARQLVDRAFADGAVAAVDAHTLASPGPSARLLEELGFQRIGERTDPEDGEIWHWRLPRGAGVAARGAPLPAA
ncbi:MAG TPA: GNAT family N-acetyltransferase [Paracoccaceae bacterium]|nr:GNAT family N-acetyltransferase [Paracoccaceae bacterium]